MRKVLVVLAACFGFFLNAQAASAASLLFAAVGQGTTGNLYILDPATGAVVTNVGALVDAAGSPYGVTGLAFSSTGTLYGVTTNISPTAPAHLVSIDSTTALVTDIGALGAAGLSTMSDISFDPTTGILYGWSAASGHQLATINTTTGQATRFGPTFDPFGGGGLAFDAAGTLYSAPDGASAQSHLNTVDKTLGGFTSSVNLVPSVLLNALAFGPNGSLYGLEGRGGPVDLVIVGLDGQVTALGATGLRLDGLAFSPEAVGVVPEPASLVLIGSGLLGLAARRRRSRN